MEIYRKYLSANNEKYSSGSSKGWFCVVLTENKATAHIAHLTEIDESADSALRNEPQMQNFLAADLSNVISLIMESAMAQANIGF